MWAKAYRDYQIDKPLIKYQVEPSHGIIGCEMHEIFGWGNNLHVHFRKRGGAVHPRISFIKEFPKKERE